MAGHVVYESLCRIGHRHQGSVTSETNALRAATITAQSPRAPAGYEQQVAEQRARVNDARIELSRHVAHCSEGCRRAPTGGIAFTDSTFDRAPAHHKVKVPTGPVLAQLLRDGRSLEELAEEYDRHSGTLASRLHHAGFTRAGQPIAAPAEDLIDLVPAKPYRYEPWMDDALCAETDPEAFFPEKGGSTREAKAVCARCTVAAECLDQALQNAERFGIWGGLSARERRALQNFPQEDPHPTQESA